MPNRKRKHNIAVSVFGEQRPVLSSRCRSLKEATGSMDQKHCRMVCRDSPKGARVRPEPLVRPPLPAEVRGHRCCNRGRGGGLGVTRYVIRSDPVDRSDSRLVTAGSGPCPCRGCGAAAASIGGALICWGIREEDATCYEEEVEAGRYLVTVETCDRG